MVKEKLKKVWDYVHHSVKPGILDVYAGCTYFIGTLMIREGIHLVKEGDLEGLVISGVTLLTCGALAFSQRDYHTHVSNEHRKARRVIGEAEKGVEVLREFGKKIMESV